MTFFVGGEERTFAVMVTRERASGGDVGSVVTFDDVTDLVVAQRTSAWADVARRIAHEIKNPLTPIQLSAERLRKKYSKNITDDRETFDRLTTTIERQVSDIKTMVDEFAAFARMPKPEMGVARSAPCGAGAGRAVPRGAPGHRLRAAHSRQAAAHVVRPAPDHARRHQPRQERQRGRRDGARGRAEARPGWKGRVETIVTPQSDRVTIEVIDNGIGLPKQNRARLLEPYVTTKGHKGTGLGLAMVQKITEQHGGTLSLEDAPPAPGRAHGALVRITLAARQRAGPTRAPTSHSPTEQAAAH